MIIFENDLYFQVLDKFYVGDKAQLLMSPVSNIESYGLDNIIRAARADFKELCNAEPVAALNNRAWKSRVATIPGVDAKNSPKKGFLTFYWK